MGKARDAYGLVLRELREGLRLGRFPAGSLFLTAELADRFRISATPVREALAYLAGEGLVDDVGGRGRRVPGFELGEAEAAYGLFRHLVGRAIASPPVAASARREAVELWKQCVEGASEERERLPDMASRLFGQLARQAHDIALLQALSRADVRLGLLRRAEQRVFDDGEAELDHLALVYVDHPSRMDAACRAYHARRMAVAETLSSLIDRAGGRIVGRSEDI